MITKALPILGSNALFVVRGSSVKSMPIAGSGAVYVKRVRKPLVKPKAKTAVKAEPPAKTEPQLDSVPDAAAEPQEEADVKWTHDKPTKPGSYRMRTKLLQGYAEDVVEIKQSKGKLTIRLSSGKRRPLANVGNNQMVSWAEIEQT